MNGQTYVNMKYTGSALPGNAETVVIFNSYVAGFGGYGLQGAGIHRVDVSIQNDQAGTLKAYASTNGTTWVQYDSAAISAASSTTESHSDWLVEPYMFWKLEWLNGATPQTIFNVRMAGTDQRPVAT